jgi:hypothetical protein
MAEILPSLPEEVVRPALTFPAFRPVLQQAAGRDPGVYSVLEKVH